MLVTKIYIKIKATISKTKLRVELIKIKSLLLCLKMFESLRHRIIVEVL